MRGAEYKMLGRTVKTGRSGRSTRRDTKISLSRCLPSRLTKPDAVRPAALKRSWYTTVSGKKDLSFGCSSLAHIVV